MSKTLNVAKAQEEMVMNDEMLRTALSTLYANDHRTMPGEADASELLALCRQAIRNRLLDDNFDFRVYLSRLVRDLYLSEAALEQGLGIEDACEFWSWFDQTMWPDLARNRALASTRAAQGTIMDTAEETKPRCRVGSGESVSVTGAVGR